MIHHTITFVAITTLHLAFVTFTMDIYRTEASIWSRTETTTAWQDHSSGTAYEQIAATNSPDSFTSVASTVRNHLNESLENLLPAFNTSNYIGNCSDIREHTDTDADEFQIIPYDEEFPDEVIRTAWELYVQFHTLIKTAVRFICTGNIAVGHEVITMSRTCVHNCTEFMVRLNGITAAIGEAAVLDTVADLYRTSIQQVKSVMELVEYLTEIISEGDKINVKKRIILHKLEGVDFFYNSSVLELSIGHQKELLSSLINILEKVGNMSEHTYVNPFINVLTSGKISRFLEVQYWEKQLEQETRVLVQYQTKLRNTKHKQFVWYNVSFVLNAIVLVMGMTSNGLLLTIFVRHKETRTLANSMLINLTVVDLLSMVFNELLEHLYIITNWQYGLFGCKFHRYFGTALFAVSTYSVAMISVQRFVVVRQLHALAWCHQSQKTKYILIAAVWGIGCILSVPHAVSNLCYRVSAEILGIMYTCDFITICVVPLLITAIFSVLTAYRIRRSAREIPGEATGHEQLKHSRMVSSAVLFALTVLFVVSYAPFLLFNFLKSGADVSLPFWEFNWIYTISYHLRFLNCCLNPIVLFVTNKRFRVYIKKCYGQREVQPAIRVQAA
jgi:hypothetical protein